MRHKAVWLMLLCVASGAATAASVPYETRRDTTQYVAPGNITVPVQVVRPKENGPFPILLYVHGRVGLSEPVMEHLTRIAQRGVVIMAPEYNFARALPPLHEGHEPDSVKDIEAAVAFIRANRKDYTSLDGATIGILAQDHGGYIGARVAAQLQKDIGALIGIYPLFSNPNQHKPYHLYQWMPEVDNIKAPSLLMIGDKDREMRKIQVGRVAGRLKSLKQTVEHIEYPGARRCFDWRVEGASFQDKLAQSDSINQIVKFAGKHVGGRGLLVLETSGWKSL